MFYGLDNPLCAFFIASRYILFTPERGSGPWRTPETPARSCGASFLQAGAQVFTWERLTHLQVLVAREQSLAPSQILLGAHTLRATFPFTFQLQLIVSQATDIEIKLMVTKGENEGGNK